MLRKCFTVLLLSLLMMPLSSYSNAEDNTPTPKTASTTTGLMTGQRAPDFTLNDIDGKSFTLSELRGNKPVLLVFWATWCPYCIKEIPRIKQIHQKYAPKGLAIISVDIAANDPLTRVQRFQKKNKLPYRILYDAQTTVSRTYGIFGVPVSIILDRRGVIQFRGNLLPDNIDQLFDRLLKTGT